MIFCVAFKKIQNVDITSLSIYLQQLIYGIVLTISVPLDFSSAFKFVGLTSLENIIDVYQKLPK